MTGLIILLLICLTSATSFPSCMESGSTWAEADMYSLQLHVDSPEQCQMICQDDEECVSFTWASAQFEVYPLSCALFSDNSNPAGCHECVSGPPTCLCSNPGECEVMDDNLLFVEQGIEKETECQDICFTTPDCNTYTYFSDSHPLRHLCFLFKDCDVKEYACSDCFSGPNQCASPTTPTLPTTVTTAAPTTEATTSTATPSTNCDNGWTRFDNFCYFLMHGYKQRILCQDECQVLGGELASVHSHDENQHLLAIVESHGSTTWLGGTGNKTAGFTWLDGTPWDYENWGWNQPNGAHEDCLHLGVYPYPAEWQDGFCYSTLKNFNCVCKKSLL